MNATAASTFIHGLSFMSVIMGLAQVARNSPDLISARSNFSLEEECDPTDDALAQFVLKRIFENYNKGRRTVEANSHFCHDRAEVSEIRSSFTLDALFSQIWHDPRLRFEQVTPCFDNLTVGHNLVESLWLAERGCNPIGCKFRARARWILITALYPVDIQTCTLTIESYAFNADRVSLNFREWDPVFSIATNKLADYHLYALKWRKGTFEYAAGSWDQLSISLSFGRDFGFYILQVYVPTSCLVLIAFISATFHYKHGRDSVIPEEETTEREPKECRSSSTTYGSIERPRTEFEDPRLRKESVFFADESKRNGNVAIPPRRAKHRGPRGFLSGGRRRQESPSFNMDPFHALTALSFGLGVHPDSLDIELPPKWTGERIDSLSRRVFPASFALFTLVYWTYYLTLNHLAKERGTQRKNCTSQDILAQSTTIVRTVLGGNYDKHLAPDANGVTVSIELAVQTFYDVSEMSASFTADVLMSQIWEDRRTVWVNYRLRVEGPCYVNLGNYPFNGEECELILESYAYNQGTVKLKWRDWSPVIEYPESHETTRLSNMSIDFWMASAVLFIGATLVELTLVGYLDRADRAKRRRAAMGEMVDEAFTKEVKSYGTFLHKFSGEQNGDHRLNFGEMGEKRRLSQRTPSAQLNYRIFQARFLYKQMQQNWNPQA
ncbi:Cation transporter family protein [Aphelenchoides fujianensis]|nr:Cation transporter family protein [Aphelenchoides fujianensis]